VLDRRTIGCPPRLSPVKRKALQADTGSQTESIQAVIWNGRTQGRMGAFRHRRRGDRRGTTARGMAKKVAMLWAPIRWMTFKIQQAVEKLRFANFGERVSILYVMFSRAYELVHRKECPLGPMKVSFSTAFRGLTPKIFLTPP
jgi:hypothetical protein